MALMPLLLDTMLLAPHTLVRASDTLPHVSETAGGWLITAALPGLAASDVSVEVTSEEDDKHLWLHAPRFKTELRRAHRPHARRRLRFPRSRAPAAAKTRAASPRDRRLPRNANLTAASSSLVDGVLKIAVPKLSPETSIVNVESEPLPGDLPEPRGQVCLALPGLGAADVSVSIVRDKARHTPPPPQPRRRRRAPGGASSAGSGPRPAPRRRSAPARWRSRRTRAPWPAPRGRRATR